MAELSTKDKLILAALDLFSQKGYSATSVDEIAESIGIKGPNIYRYFKGKADLLDELTSTALVEYNKRMHTGDGTKVWIHNAKELKEFTLNQLKITLKEPNIIRLRKLFTIEQYRTKSLSDMATEYQFTNIENMYTNIFTDLVEHGQVKKLDPKMLALEYISPITILIQLCDRDPDNIDEILSRVKNHIDFFVNTFFTRE